MSSKTVALWKHNLPFSNFILPFFFKGLVLIPLKDTNENGHEGLGVVDNVEMLIQGYKR